VAGETTGLPRIFPLRAGAVRDAYLAGATRLAHGYFTGAAGALHFQIEIEDAARHKMISAATADGAILGAMSAVARQLDPAAHSFATSNPAVIEAWGRGQN